MFDDLLEWRQQKGKPMPTAKLNLRFPDTPSYREEIAKLWTLMFEGPPIYIKSDMENIAYPATRFEIKADCHNNLYVELS